jgi:hypothetical protein
MSIDASFVKKIEYPKHSALQGALSEACTNTVERLSEMGFRDPEEWLVRKAAMAYFYDWQEDNPEYVLLLPDPGNLGKQNTPEIRRLQSEGKNICYQDQVGIYREIARKWYLRHQTDFPQEFLSLLHSHGLIEFDDGWREYVRCGEFFDDFYMTDIIKYRVGGFSSNGQRASQAFRQHIKSELSEVEPSIIFVFGRPAWNTFYDHLNPTPVNPPVGEKTSIKQSHGKLYYINTNTCAFVVPLGHMSGQAWWSFPPAEYIDRLDSALTKLRDIGTNTHQPPASLCESVGESAHEKSALDNIAEDIGEVSEF